MATADVIELLGKYIILLNSAGISVSKAYLFGSYSIDKATDQSDIDVMIVSDNINESDDLTFGKAWSLTRKIDSRIEPYLISSRKFQEELTSPLINKIISNGIEISC